MSADTLPPPLPPDCLSTTYLSRGFKGGTVIAEGVRDLTAHRRLLMDPDGYRDCTSQCWICGKERLHTHCKREGCSALRRLRSRP